MDLPSNALSANQDLVVDLLSTSVNEISRLIPLLRSLCHRYKCQTCKIYWKWLQPFTLWWKISIQKIYRSQSTSKYDRAKVSIETESRPLLSQLISYENLHISENTVTLTHKQNNEGKGKHFTLGRCSRIRETYMYQSWMYVPMDVSAQGLYLLQPSVPSWCNLKMVIFPSSGNCTIVDPINELPQQMFFNFSREQSRRHQFVRYKYKFVFGLNFRRNILSCIFPQRVAFKVKKTFIYKKLGNWTTEKELRV